MRGGFRMSCVLPSSRRAFAGHLCSGRVAVEWATEQGETVAVARSRYAYGLPRSFTRVCHELPTAPES